MKIKHKRHSTGEKKTRRINFWRRVISIILLLICAIPMLRGGICGFWVIPAAVCICMNEDCYFCMAAGILAGLLIDFAEGGMLFANAIYLVCACTAAWLLFAGLLRRSFLNYFFIMTLCTFGRAGVSYLLTQVLFRKPDRLIVWREVLLPSSLRTLLAGIAVYLMFLPLSRLLTKQVKSMDAAAIYREG